MTLKLTTVILASALLLSACIKPFQPDIQQGNIINNSDLKEIRFGMSKQEVLFILGTPMVIDPFNEQRWDYFYSRRDQQRRETEQRLITVVFKDDKVVELKGDVELANIQTLEPSTEDRHHGGTVITKPTQREKGLFNRLGILKRSDPVERRIKKLERQRKRDAEKEERRASKVRSQNEKVAAKAAKEAEKDSAKAALAAERAEKAAAKKAEREAAKAAKQASRAEKQAARAAKKAEQEASRAAKKAEREAIAAAKKAEREAAKAAKEAEREAKKAAKAAAEKQSNDG